MQALQKLVGEFWPGLPVIPSMSTDASDDVFLNEAGVTSYDATGIAIDSDQHRAHGKDERLGVQSFYTGNEFFYRFVKALATQ